MRGYYNSACIECAEEYFKRNAELISCSEVEKIANEHFLDKDPRFRTNNRHLTLFKTVYIKQIILPYIEEKLRENPEKRRTLAEMIFDFEIDSNWKPNLTNHFHSYVKQRDNDLIMVLTVRGIRRMTYQYNPECADAMREGRSEGKWLCYDDMCNSSECRKIANKLKQGSD